MDLLAIARRYQRDFRSRPGFSASDFAPRRFVRDGHVQTMLARRLPLDSVALRLEQPLLVEAGPDETGCDPEGRARLLGYYNHALRPTLNHGLVILLHGWEGSSHSSDVLFIADALLRAGYEVFRLNLRDHGPDLHVDRYAINRGLFMGTLLNETASVVREIAQIANDRPVSIVGGSMGGNFALRLAELHNRLPIHNLGKIISICPAVSPGNASRAIDRQPLYREYFRRRWYASLRAKQRLFPDLYDFAQLARMKRLVEMTDWVAPRCSRWADAQDYYEHYSFTPQDAAKLRVPTTIIAARNDAVIPVEDILALEPHESLKVTIHPTGGHMGFVDIFPYRRWLPGAVLAELNR